MRDQSFAVHLESLTDFARELQTQLDGMGRPMDLLAGLAGKPVLLGDFGEAFSLNQHTLAAVAEMHGLLDQVRQAIAFAEDVTKTVATGYEHLDDDIAASLRVAPDNPTSGSNLIGDVLSGVLGEGDSTT